MSSIPYPTPSPWPAQPPVQPYVTYTTSGCTCGLLTEQEIRLRAIEATLGLFADVDNAFAVADRVVDYVLRPKPNAL